MIKFLTGIVIKQQNGITILQTTDGVGWEVHTGSIMLREGEQTELFIYTQFRENNITLLGFEDFDDLNLFEQLLSVNGVGSKLSQALLQEKGRIGIISAIQLRDPKSLQVPGVGKKTAEKIVFHLKDTFDGVFVSANNQSTQNKLEREAVIEAIAALKELGYSPGVVEPVVEQIEKENPDLSSQELIKLALKKV